MIDLFERHFLAGDLTEAQQQRFGQQCENLSLQIRPTVLAGDIVPFFIVENCRVVGPWMYVDIQCASKIEMDGVVVREGSGGSSRMNGLGSGGASGSSIPAPSPGQHELQVYSRVELRRWPFGGVDPKDLLFSAEQRPLEILPWSRHRLLRRSRSPMMKSA